MSTVMSPVIADPVRTDYFALRPGGATTKATGLIRLVWGQGGNELDTQYLGAHGLWVSDGGVISDLFGGDNFAYPCSPGEAQDIAVALGGNLVYASTVTVSEGGVKAVPRTFNEQMHPRYPPGSPHAGEFMNKPDAIRFLSGLAQDGRLDAPHKRYLQTLEGGGQGSRAERTADAPHDSRPRLGSLEDLVTLAVPKAVVDDIRKRGLDDDLKERKKGPLARKLLGRHEDTKSLHTDPKTGAYSSDRKKLHDAIIDTFLREKKPVHNGKFVEWVPDSEGEYVSTPERTLGRLQAVLKKAESDVKASPTDAGKQAIVKAIQDKIANHRGDKRALYLAGGNASGKSTALYDASNASLLRPDPTNVEINFDLIKERIPEFQALAKGHDIYGTDATHFESADIAKRLMDEATKRGVSIIVDASGNSKGEGFQKTIKRHHEMGYRTDVLMVDAPVDVALRDSIGRATKTGRYIPAPVLRRVHRNSVRNHVKWRDADYVDGWQLYRRGPNVSLPGSAGPHPHGVSSQSVVSPPEVFAKVAEGGGGRTNVLDQRSYDAVLSKAEGGLGYATPEGM